MRPALICCALALAGLGLSAPGAAQTPMRVLLLNHQLQAVVASAGGLVVRPYEPGSVPLLTPDVTTVIDIRPTADGFTLAGSIQTQSSILISPLTDLALSLDGQSYRGSLLVLHDADQSVSVVNIVELEDYLYSVVGSEVPASTPAAALQAQAIVARTYAVAHLGAHQDLGFDLRAGDLDQAYNGTAAESAAVVNAVDATRGVVMVYGNQLAQAYYSACDGGFTSSGNALGDPQPYLQEIRDPYCPLSPYMDWTATIAIEPVISALKGAGLLPGWLSAAQITAMRAGPADASGRLTTLEVVAQHHVFVVAATAFRAAAGAREVKSTRIRTVSYSAGQLRLEGAGYGHGVGMCQLGARGMAEAGLGVYSIINFYYPGVLLTQLASYQMFRLAHGRALTLAARR